MFLSYQVNEINVLKKPFDKIFSKYNNIYKTKKRHFLRSHRTEGGREGTKMSKIWSHEGVYK